MNNSWEDGGEIQWIGDNFSAIHLFAIHPALGKLGLADRFLDEIMKSASKQEIDSIRLVICISDMDLKAEGKVSLSPKVKKS